MIKPYLSDLINEKKAIKTSSNEWKSQTNMHMNFVFSIDAGEIRTAFVWSDNEEIRLGNEIQLTPDKWNLQGTEEYGST